MNNISYSCTYHDFENMHSDVSKEGAVYLGGHKYVNCHYTEANLKVRIPAILLSICTFGIAYAFQPVRDWCWAKKDQTTWICKEDQATAAVALNVLNEHYRAKRELIACIESGEEGIDYGDYLNDPNVVLAALSGTDEQKRDIIPLISSVLAETNKIRAKLVEIESESPELFEKNVQKIMDKVIEDALPLNMTMERRESPEEDPIFSLIESLFGEVDCEVHSLDALANLGAEECISELLKMVVAGKTFSYEHIHLIMAKLIEMNGLDHELLLNAAANLLADNAHFWNQIHYTEIQTFGYEVACYNWEKLQAELQGVLDQVSEKKGYAWKIVKYMHTRMPSIPTEEAFPEWQREWKPYFQPEKQFVAAVGGENSFFEEFLNHIEGQEARMEYVISNSEYFEDLFRSGAIQPDLEVLNFFLDALASLLPAENSERASIQSLYQQMESNKKNIATYTERLKSANGITAKTWESQRKMLEQKNAEITKEFFLQVEQFGPEFNKVTRVIGALFQNNNFNEIAARTAVREKKNFPLSSTSEELFNQTQELFDILECCHFGIFREAREQIEANKKKGINSPQEIVSHYYASKDFERAKLAHFEGEYRDVINGFNYKEIEGFDFVAFNPYVNQMPEEARQVVSALAEFTLYSGESDRLYLSRSLFSHVFPFLKLPNREGSFGQAEAALEALLTSYFGAPPSTFGIWGGGVKKTPISCIAGTGGHFTAKIYHHQSKSWFELDSMGGRELLTSKEDSRENSKILYLESEIFGVTNPIDIENICIPKQTKNICYLSSAWLNFCTIYHYLKQVEEKE